MQRHLSLMARILRDCQKDGTMDESACKRLVRAIQMFNDASAALADSIGMNFFGLCDQGLIKRYGVRLDEALFGGDEEYGT